MKKSVSLNVRSAPWRTTPWVAVGLIVACRESVSEGPPPALPHASITAAATATLGDVVTFDASNSTPGVGGLAEFSFDFGDNTPVVRQQSPRKTHAFSLPAVFVVSVTVTNTEGAQATGLTEIAIVANQPPIAALVAPENALTGTEVALDATGSIDMDGVVRAFRFDFDDGNSTVWQTNGTTTHVYSMAGVYHASVSIMDDRGAVGSATAEIVVGFTLQTPINVSSTPALSQGAQIQSDATGGLEVAWQERNALFEFRRSDDVGMNFGAVVGASPADQFLDLEPGEGALATDGSSAAYLAWTWLDTSGNTEVYLVGSQDRGSHWQPPVRLSGGDGLSGGATMVALPSGTVAVAWTSAGIAGVRPNAVQLIRSTDGGSSFGDPQTITSSEGSFCPQLAAGAGQVIAGAWLQGTVDGVMDVLVARSADGAHSFAPAANLTGGERNRSCPSLWSDSSGTLIVSWIDYDVPGSPYSPSHLRVKRSLDDGLSWEATRDLASDTSIACVHGSMSADGGLYLVYSTYVFGADIYYLNWMLPSPDAGKTFLPPMPLSQIPRSAHGGLGGGCPLIIAKPHGEFAISWSASTDGTISGMEVFVGLGQVSSH